MARPKRNQNTRDALLHAGTQLLAEQGYHGTGLKEILTRVDAPKGSFYHYFASKEAFTAEIIDAYSLELLRLMDRYLAEHQASPRDTIRGLYRAMITQFERRGCIRGCLLGSLAAEIGAASEQCQQALQRAYRQWLQRFLPLLEQGQQEGQFRSDISATDLADVFWNHWEGGVLQMKMNGHAQNLRQSLDLLLDALMAPPSSRSITH